MKHQDFCRKQMESVAPEYGSECTCGLAAMLDMINERWAEGSVVLAEYLNSTISWLDKREMKGHPLHSIYEERCDFDCSYCRGDEY